MMIECLVLTFFSLIKNSWIFVLFWRVLEILSFIKWKFLSSFLKYFSALLILFSNSFVVWHFRCELSFEVHCFCSSFFYLFGLCFASRKINKSSVFFRQCFFYLLKSINFTNEFMHSTYCSAYKQAFSQCAETPFGEALISFVSSWITGECLSYLSVIEVSLLVINLNSVYKTFTGGTGLSVKDILIFIADHSKRKLWSLVSPFYDGCIIIRDFLYQLEIYPYFTV